GPGDARLGRASSALSFSLSHGLRQRARLRAPIPSRVRPGRTGSRLWNHEVPKRTRGSGWPITAVVTDFLQELPLAVIQLETRLEVDSWRCRACGFPPVEPRKREPRTPH